MIQGGGGRWRGSAAIALAAIVALVVFGGCSESTSASKGDGGPRGLVVTDPQTGRERWHVSVSERDQYYGTPGVGSGLVVAAIAECTEGGSEQVPKLDAFDARTGERRWRAEGSVGAATKAMTWSDTPTVDVAARGVIVATGGRLGAGADIPGLDAKTGKQRWKISGGEGFLGVSSGLVFATKANFNADGKLEAFDRRTGLRRWTFPAGADPAWGRTFDVVAADDTTLVVANGPYLRSPAGATTTMFVLDARTGKERLRFVAPDPAIPFSDFAIHDGLLLYADSGNAIGRDLSDGTIRWTHPSRRPGPAVDDGGVPWMTIRISTDGGTVFTSADRGFDEALDSRTGAVRWAANPPRFFEAANRSRVVVAGTDQISALDATTGKPKWERDTARVFQRRSGFDLGAALRGNTLAMSPLCTE